MLDLTFKQVCESIKKNSEKEPALIDAVDKLLGLALICSPLVASPAIVAVLPALGVKNELVKLGKVLFKRLTHKKDEDYIGRYERMEMAYGLIVFTAFFDALDSQLPEDLREKIGSLDPHRAFLVKDASRKIRQAETVTTIYDLADSPIAQIHFSFPHPTESLDQQIERHQSLWKQMAQGFDSFVQRLAFWDEESDNEKANITSIIQRVPEQVTRFFEAQYFELSRSFEDFAIWANLHEHAKTKQLLRDLSTYVKQHIKLSRLDDKALDIGFSKLHSYVRDIPETLKISQAMDLVEGFTKYYRARINDLIIEDKEDPEPNKPRLAFPRIADAFVPQAFHVLRQIGKGRQLEHEDTWKGLTRRNDLGAFLVSYLSSPYSTDTPLLILGHPGSGKSLLTTVLAAQLMSKHFTVIRVLLRKVNAEADIQSQIEEGIGQITGTHVDSWAKLSAAFKNSPPLVILDGYDELLQASGKVFASYLKDVQHFQRNEAEQGRPVRVIVTSRVTLIDKATVPPGATVVRLLEFDENQRERWISIWNNTNANYFRDAKIEEFGLPDKKESGAEKVLALAEQPLLLLMLALYDSQDNQLRKSKNLDRTRLYDSLLRRFVERERGKEKGFDDIKPAERKKALDTEMQRLGVAALGMYNRRKVHILSSELDDDLTFFGLGKSVDVSSGRALNQAELLLGSFFFIHKSKARQGAGASEAHDEASAFEFLHNTFGEFLTADFILRRAFAEVEALRAYQSNEALQEDLDKRLNDADGFKKEWFASLVYTPLFTRPVVMEMIREWINHLLKERKLPLNDFLSTLDTIVLNQVRRLLNKREMPSIICKDTVQESYRALFGDHPLLGHVAIYSMNLVLLRVLVSDAPFIFDETKIETHEDGARPWDRLTHIWRSWFSIDNLNGLTVVLTAERKENEIAIRAKERFQVAESQNRLQTCLNVGLSLGDNISSGLTGLILFDPVRDNELSIEDIGKRLASEKLDLQLEVSLKRVLEIEHRMDYENVEMFFNEVRRGFERALVTDKFDELERLALSLRKVMQRWKFHQFRSAHFGREFNLVRHVLDPRMAVEIAVQNPQAGIVLFEVLKDFGDREWGYHFARVFMDYAFRRHHPMKLVKQNPELWGAWFQLIRGLNVDMFVDRYDVFSPEFIDKAFDPRFLAELISYDPKAARDAVWFATQFGGNRFSSAFEREVFDRLTNIAELIEQENERAWLLIGPVRLAVELGVERFGTVHPSALQKLSNPEVITKLSDEDPQAAISLIKIVRSLGGKNLIKQHGPKILDRILHPHHEGGFTDLKSESVSAVIELIREVGSDRVGKFRGELLDHVHPRRILRFGKQNPELGLLYLQLVVDLEAVQFFEEKGDDLFEQYFEPFELGKLIRTKPIGFAFALRLARISKSRRGISFITESLEQTTREMGLNHMFELLPISVLADIRWLMDETNNSALPTQLAWLLDNNSSFSKTDE